MAYRTALRPWGRATLIALVALSFPAHGQAVPGQAPVTLYSEIETEWRRQEESAVAEAAQGLVLTHRHGGSFAAGHGEIGLRGRFVLANALSLSGPFGESLTLEGTLDAETALGPATALRAGLALQYQQEEETLPGFVQPLRARGTTLGLDADVGLVHRIGAALFALDAGLSAPRVGDSEFFGAALPPQRLEPEYDRLTAGLALDYALSPTLDALVRMRVDRVSVSQSETLLFGRLPADRLQIGAGLRVAHPDRFIFEAELGAEFLDGVEALSGENQDRLVRPYGRGALNLVLREGFAFDLAAQVGTRFDDAADGLADWRWRLDAEARWQADPRLALFAGLYAEGGEALLVPVPLASEWGGEVGLRYAFAPGLTLGATLGLSREVAPVPLRGDELQMAVSVRADI